MCQGWPRSGLANLKVTVSEKPSSFESQSAGCAPVRERARCGVCVLDACPRLRAAAALPRPPRVGSPDGALGVTQASNRHTGGRRPSNAKCHGDWRVHFSFHSLSKRSLSTSRTPGCDARRAAVRAGERTGSRHRPSRGRCCRCPSFLHKVIAMTAHTGRQRTHHHGPR